MLNSYSSIEYLSVTTLKPYPKNARTHSKKQIRQIADSITRFGFTNPVLIDKENTILAGHGRVEAARLLGRQEVPCIRLEHMTPQQKRAYVLADNKLALNAGWDEELLAEELKELLLQDEFTIDATGFSIAEVDYIIEGSVKEEKQFHYSKSYVFYNFLFRNSGSMQLAFRYRDQWIQKYHDSRNCRGIAFKINMI